MYAAPVLRLQTNRLIAKALQNILFHHPKHIVLQSETICLTRQYNMFRKARLIKTRRKHKDIDGTNGFN